jgi:hypothetical protein
MAIMRTKNNLVQLALDKIVIKVLKQDEKCKEMKKEQLTQLIPF